MKVIYEQPPHDELKADVSRSEKLGRSIGKAIVPLRALREGGVKDRLLLVVIGLLSIWCLSWSFETGTGLVKEIDTDVPKYTVTPYQSVLREMFPWDSDRPVYQRKVDEATPWKNFLPFEMLYHDSWFLNPRKYWPYYGLIQEWSGKAGLWLVALWLFLWVLTGKKQNELTE